jgi:alkylation response protein AidB-like acyl-CoA dehydrogenase
LVLLGEHRGARPGLSAVDFALTPAQELLRDSARSMLSKECPIALVRAQAEGDSEAWRELWPALRDWVALAAPDGEEREPAVELCLFLEETGAVLAPGPYFATVALFVPLLCALPGGHELLEPALAGEVTGTVAVAGPDGAWVPNASPVKHFVPEAGRADYVAVVAPGDGPGGGRPEGVEVALYERPEVSPLATLDPSRVLCSVDVAGASPLEPAVHLERAAFDAVMERAAVCLAAEMCGTVRWLFDSSLEYAKAREQFGRPIGSFQAIKHKLADMALAKDEAWSCVYWAAMALDAGDPDRSRAAHSAKIMAGEAATRCAKEGMQVHGGIGYTYEHDLHLYLRRAYSSEHLLGTSDWHRDALADLVLN